MNFREKFVAQTIICLMIFSLVKSAGMIDARFIKDIRTWAETLLEVHYTAEDIKQAASELITEAGNAHEAVTAAVIAANNNGQYSKILGEADPDGIQIVYAPSGGRIISAGIDDELGMYVKISHDEKISVCGNMSRISVLTGERVGKGDIIGTFDNTSGKDFYYGTEDAENTIKISA